ncbi:MAG: ChbG/HpnK family deacetylase [Acidipila sp.]|nr:ChbG/HpnK family deacetylase [Acidipila sp.]
MKQLIIKQLIVNADDFGMAEGVNRAILEAHDRGIVTSASLLAGGAAFASAVAMAREAPGLGVGVHLNLTEGRPCADPAHVCALLTPQGFFFPGASRLASRLLRSRVLLPQIEIEFRAQIEKVRDAGIEPSHLDGHQHVHMWPSIFALAARLADEYRIPGMRCSRERRAPVQGLLRRKGSAGSKILKQYGVGVALGLLAVGARKTLRRAGVAAPDYFYGVSATGFLDAATLEAILRDLPEGVSELMCHPGYTDEALRASATRLVAQREAELEALTRPEIRNLARELGIQLVNYRELGKKQFKPQN